MSIHKNMAALITHYSLLQLSIINPLKWLFLMPISLLHLLMVFSPTKSWFLRCYPDYIFTRVSIFPSPADKWSMNQVCNLSTWRSKWREFPSSCGIPTRSYFPPPHWQLCLEAVLRAVLRSQISFFTIVANRYHAGIFYSGICIRIVCLELEAQT